MNETFKARWMVTHVITERCNLNCRMCFQKGLREKQSSELSLNEIISFYRKHRNEILVVNITGGEPFIRQDCMELLSELNSLGYIISINTNGTLITSQIAEKLGQLSHLRSINISIDGPRIIHEQIRNRKGVFDKTVNSIALLREMVKPEVIQVNTMILPENIKELENHISFFESQGISRFELIFPGSYSKNEINISQSILNKCGIDDVKIDTAEEEEFKKISIEDSETVASILRDHPNTIINVVPKSFIEKTQLFIDDTIDNYNISCMKFTRKELRINSAGQIIFCDTLRKSLAMYNEIENISDINQISELITLKKAINSGLPCCKRCCKSTGLQEKYNDSLCREEMRV